MRFLTLRRKAMVTLKSESNGRRRAKEDCPALAISRDTGVPIVTVIRNNLGAILVGGKFTHFFHYNHRCGNAAVVDIWLAENEMPDTDGDHLVCPMCGMVGLRIETVPQQTGKIQIGNSVWPP